MRGFQQAVDLGWIVRKECIAITLQTAETVRTVSQFFERDPATRIILFLGEPQVIEAPQSKFTGRYKMYSDTCEENLY
jgi:hypothetical protein